MDKVAVAETVKSFLRFLYFGVLGLVSTFIVGLAASEPLQNSYVHIGGFYIQTGVIAVAILSGIAKLIDRYIHKNENIPLNGITPTDLMGR